MDALVHQRPAAVGLPGAAPACAVVVGLIPEILQEGVAKDHLAQFPVLDRFLGLHRIGVGTALQNRAEFHPAGLAGLDHPRDAIRLDVQRFLAEHVLSRLCTCHHGICVHARWRADPHDIHVGIFQHLLVVVVGLCATTFPGEVIRPILDCVGHGDQRRLLAGLYPAPEERRAHPAPDQPPTQFLFVTHLLSLISDRGRRPH